MNANGVITVSSEYYRSKALGHSVDEGPYPMERITDGNDLTFWASDSHTLGWMNYDLNTPQTIVEVTVGVRLDCCSDRYKDMCVTMNGIDGSKLAEKCTTGERGEPFLSSDERDIIVPFNSIKDVKSIKVIFNDNQFGQIRTLVVKGFAGLNKNFPNFF